MCLFEFQIDLYFCRLLVYDASDINFLRNLTDDEFNGAYMTIKQIVDYYNVENFPKINILRTKDYVQLMPLCIYYRKHSCLVRPFNAQINAYVSSGLVDMWAGKFEKPYFLKLGDRRSEPKPLSIDQITGPIAVCTICIAISVIVFILELLSTGDITAIKILLDFLTFNMTWKRESKITDSTLITFNEQK